MRNSIFLIAVVLIFFYVLVIFASTRGWGYMGYYGYHMGPSFWYFGGPRYYTGSPSVRGINNRGGGIGAGK